MKKILTHYGVWAAALVLMLVSCGKEGPEGVAIQDGALVSFTICSEDVETRTVYGDKDYTQKLQYIKWTPGDEITIVMYNPDDFSEHQSAVYVVEDKHWNPDDEVKESGMEKRGNTWWATVTPKAGQEPLRWDKNWTSRSFVAYFIPSSQESYQTPWLGDEMEGGASPQGGISADWGTKGTAMLPYHDCQPRFMLKGLGTPHIEAVPNMYYAHMYAENKNFVPGPRKKSTSPVYVPLSFDPFFTSFELTLTNPLDHAIGILGILFEDLAQSLSGSLYIQDITNPYSFSVPRGLHTAGVYIYQFDHFYAAPVNNPTHYVEYKTLQVPAKGSFTFTFFCHPKTYRQMQLQIYYDIVRVASEYGDTYAQDILPLKGSNGQYLQFAAGKKHILTIGIPESVEDYMYAFGY